MHRILEALYRARAFLILGACLLIVLSAIAAAAVPGDALVNVRVTVSYCAIAILFGALLLGVFGSRFLTTQDTVTVAAPMRGRWIALSSPASAVPSHGTRAYGQSHAIDLLYDPAEHPRPQFGRAFTRPPEDYPAFGQEVLSMVDGTVVRATSWHRDRTARASLGAVFMLYTEALFRSVLGPGFMTGNHVVIRSADGVYSMTAHLKRGSVTVSRGDAVRAGDVLGLCGNSGNSSEPHIHAQLMDRASLWTAHGIPLQFRGVRLGRDEALVDGLPLARQHVTAGGDSA